MLYFNKSQERVLFYILILCGFFIFYEYKDLFFSKNNIIIKEKNINLETNENIENLTYEERLLSKKFSVISIEIKGGIKKPGVYIIDRNMTLNTVIKSAGGFKKTAILDNIDLNKKLKESQYIFIPQKFDYNQLVENNIPITNKYLYKISDKHKYSFPKAKNNKPLLNINKITKNELTKIKGFGKKTANNIIIYRKTYGSIKNIENLRKIQGIGNKKIKILMDNYNLRF